MKRRGIWAIGAMLVFTGLWMIHPGILLVLVGILVAAWAD